MWIFFFFFFFGGLMLFLFDDRPIRYIYIFLIYSLPNKNPFFFKPWSTLPLVVSLSFFSQSDLIEFEDKELDELQYHTFFFFFWKQGGTDLLVTQKDEHQIVHHLSRVVQQAGVLRNLPWLTALYHRLPNSQSKEQAAFKQFTQSLFIHRYQQGLNTEVDVFHYLVSWLSKDFLNSDFSNFLFF